MKKLNQIEIEKLAKDYHDNTMIGFVGDFELSSEYLKYAYTEGFQSCQELNEWISVEDRLPEPNQQVLVVCDYTVYGRSIFLHIASVYNANKPIEYGGPNALTGRGKLTGIYFCIPAILAPKTVTHWQPLPPPPTK